MRNENEKLKHRRNVFVDIPCIRTLSCFLIKASLLSTAQLGLNANRQIEAVERTVYGCFSVLS